MGLGGKLDTVKASIEGFCSMYLKQNMTQPLMLLGCGTEDDESHVVLSSIVDPVGVFEDEMKMMTAASAPPSEFHTIALPSKADHREDLEGGLPDLTPSRPD